MSGLKFEKDGYTYAVPAVDVTELCNDIRAECAAKHFVATFVGDGGTEVVLPGCEFDPEFVSIMCGDGFAEMVDGDTTSMVLKCFCYDKRITGEICGTAFYGFTAKMSNTVVPKYGVLTRSEASDAMISCKDKTMVISNLFSETKKTIFGSGLTYKVVAVARAAE